MATGACHTDAYTCRAPTPRAVSRWLGHEGAGIVREIGAGVTNLKVGDHVIPLYTPECRQCKTCLSQRSNLARRSARRRQGLDARRLQPFLPCEGVDKTLFHYMGCSTFANFTVLPEIALAQSARGRAVRQNLLHRLRGHHRRRRGDLDRQVWPGANVVVFGLGGIGLNVLQGRAWLEPTRSSASTSIRRARKIARKFGMTHFINPDEVGRDKVVQAIVDLTEAAPDFPLNASANVQTMRQALECCHPRLGHEHRHRVAASGQEIATRPFQLVTG